MSGSWNKENCIHLISVQVAIESDIVLKYEWWNASHVKDVREQGKNEVRKIFDFLKGQKEGKKVAGA